LRNPEVEGLSCGWRRAAHHNEPFDTLVPEDSTFGGRKNNNRLVRRVKDVQLHEQLWFFRISRVERGWVGGGNRRTVHTVEHRAEGWCGITEDSEDVIENGKIVFPAGSISGTFWTTYLFNNAFSKSSQTPNSI